jgi:hypothetical protein
LIEIHSRAITGVQMRRERHECGGVQEIGKPLGANLRALSEDNKLRRAKSLESGQQDFVEIGAEPTIQDVARLKMYRAALEAARRNCTKQTHRMSFDMLHANEGKMR